MERYLSTHIIVHLVPDPNLQLISGFIMYTLVPERCNRGTFPVLLVLAFVPTWEGAILPLISLELLPFLLNPRLSLTLPFPGALPSVPVSTLRNILFVQVTGRKAELEHEPHLSEESLPSLTVSSSFYPNRGTLLQLFNALNHATHTYTKCSEGLQTVFQRDILHPGRSWGDMWYCALCSVTSDSLQPHGL